MEKHALSRSTHADAPHPTAVFAFPELFPADIRLLLDIETHTAIFLSLQEGETLPRFRSVPLTPASATIFLALLQAYPFHCSHQSLYRSLYPSPECTDDDAWWEQIKDLALPLIRRALKTLAPALKTCGLQAISLRGLGYLLAPATMPKGPREGLTPEGNHRPSGFPLIHIPCFP